MNSKDVETVLSGVCRSERDFDGANKGKRKDIRLWRRLQGDLRLTNHGRNLVVSLGAEGASKDLVAHRLGVTPQDFDLILETDEKAELAYRQGLAEHEHLIVQALTVQAVGDDEQRGMTTAAKELLEKVHGKAPEQPNAVNIIIPPAMSAEDLERFIEQRADNDRKAIEHED